MTILTLLLGLSSSALAVPQQLTQQGRLMDANGTAISGQHNLTFRLFDSGAATSPIWTETIVTQFNNGYYAVNLGSDSNNPLEDSLLLNYPLFLEIEVDANGPLTPRQALQSAPFARMTETAENLDGGTVNATQVSIGGAMVIDSDGSWVGPTLAMQWADISGIPSDLADGDDDTLAGINNCAPDQVLGWNGFAWGCADDNGLTEAEVEAYVTNAPLDLAAGSTMGGVDILTAADIGDTLADLSCQNGDIPKYDTLLGWTCGIDNNTSDWSVLNGIPGDIADGDDDTQLTEAQVENYVLNASIDLYAGSTLNGESIITTSTDTDTQLSENDVEQYVTNDALNLAVGTQINGQDIMTVVPCTAGQIMSHNGSTWVCSDFSTLLDADGDGTMAWADCDDNDAAIGPINNDADCDNIMTANDCDDSDASVGSNANDADCDGVDTALDCDDNDASQTGSYGESTCPGSSCKDIYDQGFSNGDGSYYIDVGNGAFQVDCDMANGGYTKIDIDYLKNQSNLSTSTNCGSEEHGYVNGSSLFYGYPNCHDYEVWYDFDLGIDYSTIKGSATFYASSGSVGGWTTSGANPDNNNYGIQSDTTYSNLDVTGVGNNKSWHRWGKPGQVFHAYNELGWVNEWYNSKTLNFSDISVVSGSILRWSGFSESGSIPNERWAFAPDVWIK